jgi:predicted lipoprotein with Yx(FWY)xxD motif
MRRMRWIGAVFALALLVAACGSDDGDDDAVSAGDGTTTTVAPSAEEATVEVGTNAEYGDMLVDAEGRSLYLFEKDQGTTTACAGPCADNWPAVTDADPVAGDGVDEAKLGTAAGDQVTYDGHLLYHFAGDKAPGDVNGAEIPAWYLVDPSGNAIEDED